MGSTKGVVGKFLLILIGAAIIVAVFAFNSAPNSLPGDFSYPLKGVLEDFSLAKQEWEFKYAGRTSMFLDMLETRLDELEKLIEKNKDKEAIEVTKRLLTVQGVIFDNLEQTRMQSGAPSVLYTRFGTILKREQTELFDLTFETSPAVAEALTKVIEQSKIDLEKLNSIR